VILNINILELPLDAVLLFDYFDVANKLYASACGVLHLHHPLATPQHAALPALLHDRNLGTDKSCWK
jgi:hypothetical protein